MNLQMTWRALPINFVREENKGRCLLNLTLSHPIKYSLMAEIRVRTQGHLAPFLQQNISDLKSGM